MFFPSNVSSIALLGNICTTNSCARKVPDPAASRKGANQVNTQAPHTFSLAIAHATTNACVEQITVLALRNQKKVSQEQSEYSSSNYVTSESTQTPTGLSALRLSSCAKRYVSVLYA